MAYKTSLPDDDTPPGVDYVMREDWNSTDEQCPECNGRTIRVRNLAGDIYRNKELKNSDGRLATPINDLDGLNQLLFAKCRGCGEVLFKHPAADLIDQIGD
jgi:hypothetical protein